MTEEEEEEKVLENWMETTWIRIAREKEKQTLLALIGVPWNGRAYARKGSRGVLRQWIGIERIHRPLNAITSVEQKLHWTNERLTLCNTSTSTYDHWNPIGIPLNASIFVAYNLWLWLEQIVLHRPFNEYVWLPSNTFIAELNAFDFVQCSCRKSTSINWIKCIGIVINAPNSIIQNGLERIRRPHIDAICRRRMRSNRFCVMNLIERVWFKGNWLRLDASTAHQAYIHSLNVFDYLQTYPTLKLNASIIHQKAQSISQPPQIPPQKFSPKNKFQPSNLIHQMCVPRVIPIPYPIPLQIQ